MRQKSVEVPSAGLAGHLARCLVDHAANINTPDDWPEPVRRLAWRWLAQSNPERRDAILAEAAAAPVPAAWGSPGAPAR
jgi:hypothetical protein